MRIVITIEQSGGSPSVSVEPSTAMMQARAGNRSGVPGPMYVDSMPSVPDTEGPNRMALDAISAGAAPEPAGSEIAEPPAFIPGAPGSPGSVSTTTGDLPAGPAPDATTLAGSQVTPSAG